jgi:hypothetical protein
VVKRINLRAMNLKMLLPWMCVIGLVIGLGALYSSNEKQTAELTKLRGESEELQQFRSAAEEAKKVPSQSDEITRLRKENEDVLRLRNQVRQLLSEKEQLTKQVQTAQAQSQRVQEQSQRAQAQFQVAAQAAQAQVTNIAPSGAVDDTLTPEQRAQAAFRARYGIVATPEQAKADICVDNLRRIDGAKQQWALENKKTADAIPTAAEITPYLKGGMPFCPVGGTYTINSTAAHPACNIPGHALAK